MIVKCFVIICSVGGCIKTALVDFVVCVCERERKREYGRKQGLSLVVNEK